MHKNIFVFVLSLVPFLNSFCGGLQGIVLDENNTPIEFANVILHKYKDPDYINGSLTGTDGSFKIEDIAEGDYFLEILYLGYKTDTLNDITIEKNQAKELGSIQLKKSSNIIDGVEVVANRPIIERKADRIVYNVENSVKSTGENVMDLLRSVPGVTVSGTDQIRINGKTEIQVMINGKIEQMTGDQLANLLKSIQSNNVKKIEVVSNPSAKYDASAKGGILDIQLKTNLKTGVNGSVYGNYRQGRYANGEVGFNVNLNYKKLTMSANYGFGDNVNFNKTTFVRNFLIDGVTQQFDETGFDKFPFIYHYANLNMQYAINEKHRIGFGGEFFNFYNPHKSDANLNILNDLSSNIIDEIQKTKNITSGRNNNPSLNLNYKGTLDTTGSTLEFGYDYTNFHLLTNSHLTTTFFDGNNIEKENLLDFKQSNPFIVNLHTSKLDYTKPLKNKNSIETGAKFTWTKTTNDIEFDNLIDGIYVLDSTRSNAFQYIENINAAYLIWNKQWEKGWSTNVGLRTEQTNTNQLSITLDSLTKRSYIDFFPSAFIQKTIKEKHSLNLNYSRKIHRPNFEDLNPFQFYRSQYSIWTGNANLIPEYINVTEFSYSFDNTYTFNLGHENIKNSYTHLAFQDDTTKITTYKASNFKVRNNLNLGVNINKELYKWWILSFSAQYTFFKYDAIVNNQEFNLSSNKVNVSVDNTFILPKQFKINVFAFYDSPYLDATDVMKSNGMVNISISKSFFDKKLLIRLMGNDIFNTLNMSYTTNFANVDSETTTKFNSRQVGLSIVYNFQKGKQFENSNINKSNQEEKDRIN